MLLIPPRINFSNLAFFYALDITELDYEEGVNIADSVTGWGVTSEMLSMGIAWMVNGKTYVLKGDYRVGEA